MVVAVLLLTAFSANVQDDPTKIHRVVALLDYVASDYPRAVVGGRVINRAEYEEQVLVAGLAKELAGELDGVPTALSAELIELESACRSIATGEAVEQIARSARRKVVATFRIKETPMTRLSFANGLQLYAANCASCHGAEGVPPPDKLKQLQPPPRTLADAEVKNHLSPYQIFNALTFGVTGTAMPSFDALPAADRWDLAFFVLTLRGAAKVRLDEVPLAMTTSTVALSTSTDRELREALAKHGAGAPALDALRIVVPYLAGAREDIARSRRRLGEALASGSPSIALDAYASSFAGSAELLRRLDAELVAGVQADFTMLREQLARDERHEAVETRARLDDHLDRAEVLLRVERPLNVKAIAGAIMFLTGMFGLVFVLGREQRVRLALAWVFASGCVAAPRETVCGHVEPGAVQYIGPAHGTLALLESGAFLYTPEAGFSGEDSFTYRAGDALATARIDVR